MKTQTDQPTHTPGPWEYRSYAEGTILCSSQARFPGSSIQDHLKGVKVLITEPSPDPCITRITPDARLLRAAPRLLEAVKLLLEIDANPRPTRAANRIAYQHANRVALAAVAEATGVY